MSNNPDKLLALAYKAEKRGDRVDAIRLYRQVAQGDSERASYAENCAENLEQLGIGQPTYLLGGGSYDNLTAYRLVIEKDRVSLAPAPMAWSTMIACNCLLLTLFASVIYLTLQNANAVRDCVFIAVLAAATCALFNIVVYVRHQTSKRRGEILVYQADTKKISLPDRGLHFSCDDDVHIECITARPEGSNCGDDLKSELNFVHTKNGEIERWNLLGSNTTIKPFGKLVKQLKQELPIPIRRS